MHGDLSGKITGMLLDLQNAELLAMLDNPDFLIAKVEEAVEVFKAYRAKVRDREIDGHRPLHSSLLL